MLQFCSLYSGSSGNSFLIKSDNTAILVDSGVSSKKITEALDFANVSINNIEAILVTHEHIDHVRSVGMLSAKYNIPVYANSKTWDSLDNEKSKISNLNKKTFNMLENFEIGDLKIFPFRIPHDAADPCGFSIYNCSQKISIATDLGHIDTETLKHLENSSSVLLEANYDPEILKFSSYPYILKRRIAGPNGHLSNNMSGDAICQLIHSGLQQALLVHLSKQNNFPELAHKTVEEVLTFNNCDPMCINLFIAPRNNPSEMLNAI